MTARRQFLIQLVRVFFLVCLDVLAFYASLFAAWYIRDDLLPLVFGGLTENFTFAMYVGLWWVPVTYVSFNAYNGMYGTRLPFWDDTRRLSTSITLSMLIVMVIVNIGQMSAEISRVILVLLWCISLFVFPVCRLLGKRALFRFCIFKTRALILGAGNTGRLVNQWLTREKAIGIEVVGFLDDDRQKINTLVDGKMVFGEICSYAQLIKNLKVSTVIIALPSLGPKRIATLAFELQLCINDIMIVPDLCGVALLNTELLHLFYEEIFLLKIRNNLKFVKNRIIKRLFDIVSGIVLLPMLLIMVGIIGLLIRLESRGPVIYSHLRIGKGGRLFKCYKFRTMVKDADTMLASLLQSDSNLREWQQHYKLTNDPRVTRIGNFLRKTSLDELPQIFNVLKGEMSIIGPRPVTEHEVETYYKELAEACFSVLPGITGLWQVSGRNDTTYDYRIRLDSWYIMNWSLWLDIVILIKTVSVVFFMKGAR
ncbi:undecaprenyl-phosphate galactose phosphotransferase WbaP [Candidatus Magnetobacterium casense]|uniref:Undecaprenyl-phosphate galactose phosphotransferase WbaP n=1 Tax=Candidatus Magnetobacterium casense TaxID=1455061 RepID=A0ABS6S4F5_9BACT|nr:undecaprenyl-phosphate galactose phosphotransferase WbaP [Candidatus Magnetobacterium casensis]MBV6343239.1 undecaprenyl-phosphate galactose phosphotransferase WbaP [Candidatus Magnetobacterium casensis]